MILSIQIYSFCISLGFGIFLYGILSLHQKLMAKAKKIVMSISCIILFIDLALLYFLILKQINKGVIHPYFLLLVALGALIAHLAWKHLLSRITYIHCSRRH